MQHAFYSNLAITKLRLWMGLGALLSMVWATSLIAAIPQSEESVPETKNRNTPDLLPPRIPRGMTEAKYEFQWSTHRALGKCSDGVDCTWEQTFGGPLEDKVHGVVSLADGDFVVTGHTRSHGGRSYDGFIARLAPDGTRRWHKILGGADADLLYGVVEVPGGFVVAGHTKSVGAGDSDAWVTKVSADGEVMWSNAYGGEGKDRARGLAALSDGSIAAAGFSSSSGAQGRDFWVFKVDATGRLVWEQIIGGAKNDEAFAIEALRNDDVVVAGYSNSGPVAGHAQWIAKFVSDGNLEWQNSYGNGWFSVATAIAQTTDNRFCIVGLDQRQAGERANLSFRHVGAGGELIDTRVIGGPRRDSGWGVTAGDQGACTVLGSNQSAGAGSSDGWLLQFTNNSDIVWERTFGEKLWDKPTAIARTLSGGYVVAGYTTSKGAGYEDAWLVRLNANGKFE